VLSLVLLFAARGGAAPAFAAEPVRVPAGDFSPLIVFENGQQRVRVAEFAIDRRPVTRAAYAEFIVAHPEWRRAHVPASHSDAQYLEGWDGDRPRAGQEKYPVTYVSWFAATTYCQAHGGRLPSTLEWEYVAAASQTEPDAERDPAFIDSILGWYAGPGDADLGLAPVGGPPNYFGIENLHGLVWEWTSDFNTAFVPGDDCARGPKTKGVFCDSGAMDAVRRDNYPAYMRNAMRGSLGPRVTLGNLGFRCAYDVAPTGAGEGQ